MATTICTNHQPRHLVSGYELSIKERKEFDYIEAADFDSHEFFRYRGNVYDLSEFMRCSKELALLGWDGYAGDSYFSGVLIKLSKDGDSVTVARYYA